MSRGGPLGLFLACSIPLLRRKALPLIRRHAERVRGASPIEALRTDSRLRSVSSSCHAERHRREVTSPAGSWRSAPVAMRGANDRSRPSLVWGPMVAPWCSFRSLASAGRPLPGPVAAARPTGGQSRSCLSGRGATTALGWPVAASSLSRKSAKYSAPTFNLAIEKFFLGETLGRLYYSLFPPEASAGTAVISVLVVAGLLAVLSAFSGLVTDPIQSRLGIHRRRLMKLVDSLEAAFLDKHSAGFNPRDHYLARVLELIDIAKATLSSFPKRYCHIEPGFAHCRWVQAHPWPPVFSKTCINFGVMMP